MLKMWKSVNCIENTDIIRCFSSTFDVEQPVAEN